MAVSEGGSSDAGDPALQLSPEEYEWLQEQLRNATQLEVEDEYEDEWEDPSGGLLSEIFAACQGGQAGDLDPLLRQLRDTDFSVDTPGPDGDTPLHIACLFGSAACAQALLDAGADPAALNPEDGSSPLHDAAAGGFLEIVEALLRAAGGDADADAAAALAGARDADGDTPLHNAARGEHPAVVRRLLAAGADPGAANAAGHTPADESASPEVATLLEEHRAAAPRQDRAPPPAGGGDDPGGEGQQAPPQQP